MASGVAHLSRTPRPARRNVRLSAARRLDLGPWVHRISASPSRRRRAQCLGVDWASSSGPRCPCRFSMLRGSRPPRADGRGTVPVVVAALGERRGNAGKSQPQHAPGAHPHPDAALPTPQLLRTQLVPQILAAMPSDWRGTTFNNSNLLGRKVFSERLQALLVSKAEAKLGEPGAICADDLTNLGNAEDYMRVATNVSTVYENVLALGRGMAPEHVFSFASATMPVVAVVLTGAPVHLYHGDAPAPFTAGQIGELAKLGGDLTCHHGSPAPSAHPGATVLALDTVVDASSGHGEAVDGIVGGDASLFITNAERIVPSSIMTVRKRMATPITTPAAEQALQSFCGLAATADVEAPSAEEVAEFNAHLQTMSGTAVNPSADPVTCSAGLPTIAALWLALEGMGGADILMCSTAYGGSSELTDLCLTRENLRKSTFHIQGGASFNGSIEAALGALAADPASLRPTTVLFVEIPSNPDQKMPDLAQVSSEWLVVGGWRLGSVPKYCCDFL